MNGPQRTACLAKGCINNQYQLTIPRQNHLQFWREELRPGSSWNQQQDQLEHTCKPYTDGQLTGYMPVSMMWRTTARNHGRTDRQCAILSLAGSQNLCQTMNRSDIYWCLHVPDTPHGTSTDSWCPLLDLMRTWHPSRHQSWLVTCPPLVLTWTWHSSWHQYWLMVTSTGACLKLTPLMAIVPTFSVFYWGLHEPDTTMAPVLTCSALYWCPSEPDIP